LNAEVQTVRNTTSPRLEMDFAFSWLVEKQPIYHATPFWETRDNFIEVRREQKDFV